VANMFWDAVLTKVAAGDTEKPSQKDGTPEPQVGEKVKVQLEDRTQMDSQQIIPMGEVPGTKNPADGDPWDVAPIDIPLSKTKGTVTARVIGKIKLPDGNDKLIAKTKPGVLSARQKQNIQSYVAARSVWQKGLKIKVPGVKDVKVTGVSGKPTS
jgi:inorganic pyrophosphatase